MTTAASPDQQPDRALHAAFLRRRRMMVLGIAGFIFFQIGAAALGDRDFAFLLFLLAMASLMLGVFSWRCPKCGYFLTNTWRPYFCWRCGVRLC